MKRCPQCGREYDNTMSFCLDDGAELLYGPASGSVAIDEPQTAILHETAPPSEAATRAQIHTTEAEPRARLSGSSEKRSYSANRAAKPLAVAAIVVLLLIGAFFSYRYFATADSGEINSIAVLPFANATGDKETDFLSDGIAETLINNFTKISELKVAARSTAFRFRGRDDQPQEIGRELGVGAILTGTVHQQDDNVRVQVDLINTADGSQVWGQRYDGKVAQIVNIQQRIAADVASRLKLSTSQTQQIARTYTQNADAYQHYLRGRHHWNKRTAEGLKSAIEEFQLAIDKDPAYALAYAGLADCYLVLEQYVGTPNREVLPKAKEAAEQALRIDDSLAEAHTSMASVHVADWNLTDARREYQRAIELNPNYATAHHWYSIHLRDTGRFEESVAEAIRAQALDPLSNVINSNLVASYLAIGDLDAAERQAERSLQLDPNFGNANYMSGLVHLARGRQNEGLRALQKSVDASHRSSQSLGFLGYGLGLSGKRAEALAIAKELEERNAKGEALGSSIATVYAGLGDKDAAFDWLDRDYRTHAGALFQIVWMQPFVPLRDDPRFRALVQKMNIRLEGG